MGTKKSEAGRFLKILEILRDTGPKAAPGLTFGSRWELLVATVLSAQCTDARVNSVTKSLFAAYPGPFELAGAEAADVERLIKTLGLYRNKARNIVEIARIVMGRHNGETPGTREELQKLPGVGRKTASVVLSQGFDVPAFAVDTHVGRVCVRLGFSPERDPAAVEQRVTALIDPALWKEAHLLLIRHGRRHCAARKPSCPTCPVKDLCPWPGKQG